MVRAINWSTQQAVDKSIDEFSRKCKNISVSDRPAPDIKYLAIYDLETYHVASIAKSNKPKEKPLIGIYSTPNDDYIDSLPDIYEMSVSVFDIIKYLTSDIMPEPIETVTYTKKNAVATTGSKFAVWRTVHHLQQTLAKYNKEGVLLMAHNGFNYDHRIVLAHSIIKKLKLHTMKGVYLGDTLRSIRRYPSARKTNSYLYQHCFPEDDFTAYHTASGDVYTTSRWAHKLRFYMVWRLILSMQEFLDQLIH